MSDDSNPRHVTFAQLFLAIVGEFLLFLGYLHISGIAGEKRLTTIEERVNAIYNQLPQLRAKEEDQEKRLRDLEHK